MIKLIIFDFSNVCFTLEEPPFLIEFAEKHHLPFREFEKMYLSLLYRAEVNEFSGKEVWNRILKNYNLKANPKTIIETMMNAKQAHQDILALAKELRTRYKTAYFTNYNEEYWKCIERRFDLLPYFNWGVVSYQVKTRKPAVVGFNIILKHFKVQPEEAVFIDDQEKNLVEARTLGIQTILFKDKEQLIKELKKCGVNL